MTRPKATSVRRNKPLKSGKGLISNKKIRIYFADDHSVVRNGLQRIFDRSPDFYIVGVASNGEEAVKGVFQKKPDVVILDISMPKMSGIEAARIIKQKMPETKVLIFTIHEDEEYVYQCVRAGVNGYLLKNAEEKEILSAVRTVTGGDPFFSPGISKLIIEKFVKRTKEENSQYENAYKYSLSKKERVIWLDIAHGKTTREIAKELFLSPSTVNSYIASLKQKLKTQNKAGLIALALRDQKIAQNELKITFHELIEIIKKLSLEEKEELKVLLEKFVIEARREEIIRDYLATKKEEQKEKLTFHSDTIGFQDSPQKK